MGRTKYSSAERKAIMQSFIKAAQEIISKDGISRVSIRRVSADAGYSSATLYLYFKDIDELTLFASFEFLEDYTAALAEHMPQMQTHEEAYFKTWEIFCTYAFSCPQVYYHLFFSQHSSSLDEITKQYYSIFPQHLENISGATLAMLVAGNLYERNYKILAPYAAELGFDNKDAHVISNMNTAYFHALLDRACTANPDEEGVAALTEEFMETAYFLLRRSRKED